MGSAMIERNHRRQRWAARGALASVALAASLPLVTGGLNGLLLLAAGLAGLALTAAAVWWVLSRRGPARTAAAALAVVAPVAVITLFAVANLLWVVFASLLLWCLAVWSGRYALRSTGLRPVRVKEYR
ncbi:diacylglycerol kinase, partial [Streptomyces coeruleorubidus]